MGRVKVNSRKKGGHSEESMRKAIDLVKAGMSIRNASKECHLSYPTVRRYVAMSKLNPEIQRLTPNYEVNAIFTREEESYLKEYIEHCAQIFYGLSSKDCRRVAYQMAKINKKNIPPSWTAAEMAGVEWLRSFKKRHPELSLRKPEACSIARATAFNKHTVGKFFSNLKSVMQRHPSFSDGTRLYNLDETSTTTVQRPGKVLARKGMNVGKVTSGERGTLVTTCFIVSATGQSLPPAMVFPRKKFQPHMLSGAPSGTLGLAAPSGWMNTELFLDVMKHFIKHTSASKDNPALLIMDNHESHLSIEALDMAKSSGVTILTLHPHTTAKLQPLDVGLNGPFKTYYNADSWLLRNPGRPLTIYNIAECVGSAYLKAMTPVNIVNAFKKCGIFPFDENIFTDEDFLPSTVTDRPQIPLVQEGEISRMDLVTDNVTEERPTSPSILTEPALEDMSAQALELNNITPPFVTFTLRTSSPVPTTSHFISPMQFMPPIKAKPRDSKKRTLGKSMIATDTPEKEAISLKKKKRDIRDIKKVKKNVFTENKSLEKIKKKVYNNMEEDDTSDDEEFVPSGSSSGGEEYLYDDENDNIITLDDNFKPLPKDPKVGEFVIILFSLKKGTVYYVAKILEIIDDNDEDTDFFVSFLRLKNRLRQTFWEPIIPDMSGIQIKDIKYILPKPKVIGSSRRQATFSFDVDMSQLTLR